ncbi:DUF4905 domain-containing protein [Dyadobacter sandarakinus]|uniref:DUF4905 domain-containing protein n=1 Tax=Dyadobacter sandarakinus TaxID=2747268 RepID=A0ABX7I8C8_9BACT|nr:DUF4905 domain-containing protein [Dyadobacter sandarakinus]QRR01722.1 DUF4905 domain-containing protein [Dyadobacter sandarakinus]
MIPDPDPAGNRWAIELRHIGAKSVSFAILDLDQQRLLWEKHLEGADWWSSLTAFAYNRIYIHQYRVPEVPEPSDLLCISGIDASELWVLPRHILVSVHGAGLLEVAVKSGETFRKLACDPDTGATTPWEAGAQLEDAEVILKEPVRYKVRNAYFDRLAAFIEKVTGHKADAVDYLEKRPYIVFSYYIYEQEKSVQYLLIVNKKQELVLHERLSEERQGIGRSTMMLRGSTLVYLKNNNEFSSLTLPE